MMQLSSYVVDPLTTPIQKWRHPITQAEINLSSALKRRLPEIMQVDLKKEACGSEEIFNQLLAAELRDLGFLIPSDWSGREEECIAFYRRPIGVKHGFYSTQSTSFCKLSEGVRAIFLSVGNEGHLSSDHDAFTFLRQRSQRLKDADRAFPQYEVDLFHQKIFLSKDVLNQCQDLGHICTAGLSDDQIAQKMRDILPYFPKNVVPVLFTDTHAGLFPIIRESDLWNRDSQSQGHQILVMDREIRFGSGFSRQMEQKSRTHAGNLFAHLQWAKKPGTHDIYMGAPRIFSTRSDPQVSQEIINDNRWITRDHMIRGAMTPSLDQWVEHEVVVLVHANIFDRTSKDSLGSYVGEVLEKLGELQRLKGIIFWGFDSVSLENLDTDALNQACMTWLQHFLVSSALEKREEP